MRVWERGVGHHAGLRHGRLCDRGRGPSARPRGPQRRYRAGRRRARHRVARRRRPYPDDGPVEPELRRRGRPREPGARAMSAPEIITFGCRLNAYESEAIRARAAEAGLDGRRDRQHLRGDGRSRAPVAPGDPQGAPRQSATRRSSSPAARRRPSPRPMPPCPKSTACSAIARSSKPQAMPASASTTSNACASTTSCRCKETAAQFVDSFEGRARAFLQVQNGCDHRCTFCIIPYGRGNSRSVPMGAVVEEARRLVEAGFPEIVLTGVDLTAYGADLPGAPIARPAGAQAPEAGAGAEAPAAFLHRLHRGRRRISGAPSRKKSG